MSKTRESAEQMCISESCELFLRFSPINHFSPARSAFEPTTLVTQLTTRLTHLQGLEKVIPDTPQGETPVHLKNYQIFANGNRNVLRSGESDVGVAKN